MAGLDLNGPLGLETIGVWAHLSIAEYRPRGKGGTYYTRLGAVHCFEVVTYRELWPSNISYDHSITPLTV
jgi:hypothetical protein